MFRSLQYGVGHHGVNPVMMPGPIIFGAARCPSPLFETANVDGFNQSNSGEMLKFEGQKLCMSLHWMPACVLTVEENTRGANVAKSIQRREAELFLPYE